MNRHSFVPMVFVLLAAPLALGAQTGDQSNLVLSIFGGVTAGHPLWHLDRQPVCVLQQVGGSGTGVYQCEQSSSGDVADTLMLDRQVSSSILAGAAVSYFKNAHIGFEGEIYYLGLSFDDRCVPVSPYQADAENKNQQACENFSSSGVSLSAVSFIGNVVLRASPRGIISPYIRGGIGLTAYSGGTIAASGEYVSSTVDPTTGIPLIGSVGFIADTSPKTASVTFQLAAGITSHLSPGYQIRFELRDAILPLQRVIGPANESGQAPIETKFYHHFGLAIGLDVVLEHKRGRRY